MRIPVHCLVLLFSALALAISATAQTTNKPEVLPQQCEIDLALSAAPEHLRAQAGLYLLTEDGYVRHRESQNGFTCIVNRDHPRVIKPTCFDAEGSTTIIPKIVRFGELLMAGTPLAEIQQTIRAGFADGTFISPQRPGIAYMLSNYNRPYNPPADQLGWFPPHYMFYAPNLTGEDIGFSPQAWQANRNLPLIGYEGPHGFMIVLAEERNTVTPEDFPACPDWVRANPPMP